MRREGGFTLPELMVHIFVASLIFMMIVGIVLSLNKLYSKMRYRYSVEMRLLDTIDAMRVWSATSESMDWFYLDQTGEITDSPSDKAIFLFYPSFPGDWVTYQVKGLCQKLDIRDDGACDRLTNFYKKNVLELFGKPNMVLLVRKVELRRGNNGRFYVEGIFLPDRLKHIVSQIRLPRGIDRLTAWNVVLLYMPDPDSACNYLGSEGIHLCDYNKINERDVDEARKCYYGARESCGNMKKYLKVKEAIALDDNSLKDVLAKIKKVNLVGVKMKTSLRFYPDYVYYITPTYSSVNALDRLKLATQRNKFTMSFQVREAQNGLLRNEMFSLEVPVALVSSEHKKGFFKKVVNEEGQELNVTTLWNARNCNDDKCKGKELEGIIMSDD